jgi:uncharacterized protein YigE (DUF2233 family)
MRLLVFSLLVSLLFSSCTESQSEMLSSARLEETDANAADCVPDWQQVAAGADYRYFGCDGKPRRLHLLRVDPQVVDIDAVVAPNQTAEEVATGRLFAINANFFDPEARPLGLVRSGGRDLNKLHKVSWQSVFLVTRSKEPRIIAPADWPSMSKQALTAVQAGPGLVTAGRPNRVKRATPDFRSGVCITPDRRVIFFATDPLRPYDVHEIRDFAAAPAGEGGLGCRDAMLFDGGPSTQFFLARDRGDVHVSGDRRDPVYVIGGRR